MPYYDKLAHVVSAIALGLLIFAFFLVLDYWEIRIRPSRILAAIFVLVLLFGCGWEIGEYYIDLLVQSSYNNGVMDSILDCISNILGALVAMLIARYYLKSIPEGKTPGYLLQTGT
jgi:VanZ family protein